MGWNPDGIQVEIDKNLAGLPAKKIPGGMTRNLWGSVKSSPPPLPPPPTAAAAGLRFDMSRAFGMFSSAVATAAALPPPAAATGAAAMATAAGDQDSTCLEPLVYFYFYFVLYSPTLKFYGSSTPTNGDNTEG